MGQWEWNDLNGEPVLDTVIGVIDHCTFIQVKIRPNLHLR